jgi:hypothetical protein
VGAGFASGIFVMLRKRLVFHLNDEAVAAEKKGLSEFTHYPHHLYMPILPGYYIRVRM